MAGRELRSPLGRNSGHLSTILKRENGSRNDENLFDNQIGGLET